MNHSRTRTAALVAAVAVPALVFTGCAGSGGSEAASDTISVVTRWASGSTEAEIQQRVFDKFTEDTGIKVEFTDGLEEIDDQVETAVAAGKAPDLVIVNLYDKTLGWLDAGVTVPLDDQIEEWGLADRIQESALDEWRVGSVPSGELQGLPYSGFSWPIWYNTDLLAQAGVTEVPETTDDLIAASTALRAAGIPPLIVGGNDWSGQKLFYQIIQSYADADATKKVMSEGGYCESDDIMKGIDLFTQLRDAGVFVDDVAGYTADDMYATYFAEKAAIMPAASWEFAPALEAGTDIQDVTQLGGLAIPADGTFTQPTAYQGFTGVGFMVTKQGAESDRVDLVRQLIEAFYSDDAVADFVTNGNNVTPVIGDFADKAENPLLKAALDLGDTVDYAVLPDVWIGSSSDPLIQVITKAYGGGDAQEICAGLDQATL
ncbi:ABC transporter substrate-binding protein [Compostimonas suwonensis]|uniref:Multiple sugar transport system substrate-binding protein n=1 Tax=Compostimonas suwonensis TaxID=1048394 RepID=A0A2M9BC96_9MICO|nr:extracellular solute-binding protein [Compostimonas suwonensis]PJJ55534.1 multiple sugar transport system substrate-binding protein [Compostimonas suwonensis]